ncbi:hypothetical protein AMTR_s00011p00052580 [Amborella trichopoda]|uniref:Uncharacterized protein n=1 Tax=Amborella trichopoda TaxID=13333 RepID=W1NHA5_AMBTC|nr:hypothetical protein AMTR_s00011p00052580 [Amborella trichopoda]
MGLMMQTELTRRQNVAREGGSFYGGPACIRNVAKKVEGLCDRPADRGKATLGMQNGGISTCDKAMPRGQSGERFG